MSTPISIPADGATITVPAVWLRLQCPCAECFVPGIGERRVRLHELPVDLSPTSVCRDDAGSVTVVWPDDHRSHYAPDLLARLVTASTRRPPTEPVLWDGDHAIATVDHDTFWADLVRRTDALEHLRDEGTIVVTAMPTESGEVGRFLQGLGAAIREVPFARIHDITFSLDGYNIAFTADPLPPHTDLASYSWPPSGQLLHMLHNNAEGGHSIVVDGWNVVEGLRRDDPEAFAVLATTPVPHRIYSESGETFARQPIIRLDHAGAVTGVRYSNQTLQPLPLDEPQIDAWYAAYRELSARVCDPANQATRRLAAGDMLVVNGHRVLHGRTGFGGEEVHRHLQDAYFEFDDVMAHLDRLRGEAPTEAPSATAAPTDDR